VESIESNRGQKPSHAGAPGERQVLAEDKSSGQRSRRNGDVAFDERSDERRFRNLIKALTAAGRGDFSVRLPISHKDKLLDQLAMRFNAVVERNEAITSEIIRVEQAVRREGRMTERATVKGAVGGWQEIEGSINSLIGGLVQPTTEVARVIGAVAQGDLSQKMALEIDGQPVKGEFLRIGTTVNAMVDQLSSFADEVTRVAKEVGTDGKLGGQAQVKGVSGTWKDLTDNVNVLARNLTDQVRNIATVTTAVANGDLSQKITVDVKGEILELKNTMNTMVDQLRSFAAEVTRVAREVGTEGKLGGQADVQGVSGVWKDLTDNVNFMASNLTTQVRGIVKVVTAVANGDLSQKLIVDARGEIAALADTINGMTATLGLFAEQVTDVARTVGVEGKLGAQAEVPGVAGTWKDLTDNVNLLANNLTAQVRNIAEVTTSVAKGDLSKKITVDAKGEILELKDTMNTMVDQLNSFASEVTRVAREVGTEGKLGGQAEVRGVSGVWKDLTDNVNFMASNLTTQVRGIVRVITAVANGDLSPKLEVAAKGEIAALADTLNSMTKTLAIFAEQVTSVAKTVGVEGKLGAQAEVPNVAGTWKDLTDNVNLLANNLTAQVRNIAEVTTAVARGDLSKKISVDVKGEILQLKNTMNTMVDQLRSFASEVTRVAREVGTEGKLGGQAEVQGVEGIWKDLTDNVNVLAGNLTDQVRGIVKVVTAVANGDLSKKISVDVKGEILELKNTINTMVDQLNSFGAEVTRVAREVGTEGKLGGQAEVKGVSGVWKDLTDNVNFMASNLTTQVRGIVKVVTAVANGDLKQKLVVDARGEVEALAVTINNMTDTLSTFAEQVSTVAREVGVEGKLGGQARVPGVAGTWKDLTDNVNFMASNLTTQVRGIVKVVTAVANGDLAQKLIGVEAKGEIAALADTINSMTETLGIFADQVSTVAREVGIEGKLGGQARVPGAAGTWRDLTDNVNQLAGNLTAQVRAISDVATAVTKGDLTRSIKVEALGEVAALSDNINQMIVNLKETTQKNQEQDWLKTNLAKFSSMMQGQKNLQAVSRMIMSELTPLVSAHQGAFFLMDADEGAPILKLMNTYAYRERKGVANRFLIGEGLVGQCALEKKSILLTNAPHDYIHISSGLGEAPPLNIIVLPILFEGEVKAVIELASFNAFSSIHQIFLDQLSESIGVVLNMIMANMRTEELLQQSQGLTQELQNQSKELTHQQETLKSTNTALERQALELEEKAKQLEEQNTKVEIKNREVEQARKSLEEKAEQLALVSKYKSEFLANMSHELRTPLNSLLILAKVLSDNKEANLSEKQLEYARTIYSSGSDLLKLISEVLDLSKVEAGKMAIDVRQLQTAELVEFAERSFRALAEEKGLEFSTEVGPGVAEEIRTDRQRVEQVLRNLLANAIKFTESGSVKFRMEMIEPRREFESESLKGGGKVLALSVTDTGIGIAKNKQRLIFEAFQQADGSTSRRYGGTGLGLSISREIARALGGEIHVESSPGEGSVFTLYMPIRYGKEVEAFGAREDTGEMQARLTDQLQQKVAQTTGAVRDFLAAAPAVHELSSEALDSLKGKTVLIVDDDPRNIFAVRSLLEGHGMKTLTAENGRAGIAMLERHPEIDIALIDIMMPEMDGYETMRLIRANPAKRWLPMIAVTAKALQEDRERCMAAGASDYLAKPIDDAQLVELIRIWSSGTPTQASV
jgi:HAMP domain-containing protein/signal transduction histidine kinase/ActR/RegA family two-component response regulator